MEDTIIEIFDGIDLRATTIRERSGVHVSTIQVYVHPNDMRFCSHSDEYILKAVQAKIPDVIGVTSSSNCFYFTRKP